MEKKITVYVVKAADKEQVYPTQSRAKDVVATLEAFGVTAEIEKVKRTVTLA